MADLEYLTFLAYCAVAPAAWSLYALGMVSGLRRLSLLNRTPAFSVSVEDVAIIVPVRNEAGHIEACVRSLLAQSGVSPRIVAINDRSTDETPALLDAVARHDPRLQVIHLAGDSPTHYTGKCAAIIRGLEIAALDPPPKWLLFVDSDVTLGPDAIAAALRLALRGRDGDSQSGHDLVSLLPRQDCRTLAERAAVPLFAAAIVGLWGVAYANNDRLKSHAFACGQFLLVRRDLYEELGGHAAVGHQLSEDVGLAMLAKRAGAHPRVASATEFATVRQHAGTGALVSQWARNFYGMPRGRPWTLMAGLAYIAVAGCSLPAAAIWAAHRWLDLMRPLTGASDPRPAQCLAWSVAVAIHAALMAICLSLTYRAQRLTTGNALLAPYGSALLIAALLRALWISATGQVTWRGRTLQTRPVRPPPP